MPKVVKTFDGDYMFLSNFDVDHKPFEVKMFPDNDVEFATGEHGYQAYKAFAVPGIPREDVIEIINEVIDCETPGLAKKVGRKIKIDTDHWDSIKDRCMRTVVFEKFAANPDYQDKLLATGAAMLVEGNTWGDVYWGRVDGKGLNRLGAILMEVRGFYHYQNRIDPQTAQAAHILMGW